MREKMSTESVKSPSNSKEKTIQNAGGFPPTMEPKAIFSEAQPPSRAANDSTVGIGSKMVKED